MDRQKSTANFVLRSHGHRWEARSERLERVRELSALGGGEVQHGGDGVEHVAAARAVSRYQVSHHHVLQVLQVRTLAGLDPTQPDTNNDL